MDTLICSNPIYNINDDFWIGRDHLFLSIYYKNGIAKGNTELLAINKAAVLKRANWVYNLGKRRIQSNYVEDESNLFFMTSSDLIVIDKNIGCLLHSVNIVNIFTSMGWTVLPNAFSYIDYNLIMTGSDLMIIIRCREAGKIAYKLIKLDTFSFKVNSSVDLPFFPHCFQTFNNLIFIKCSEKIVIYDSRINTIIKEIDLPEYMENGESIDYSDVIAVERGICSYRLLKGKNEYIQLYNVKDESTQEVLIGENPYYDDDDYVPQKMLFKVYGGAIFFISTTNLLYSIDINSGDINWITERSELDGIFSWEIAGFNSGFNSSQVILRSFNNESLIVFVDLQTGKTLSAFLHEKQVFGVKSDSGNKFILEGDDYKQKKSILFTNNIQNMSDKNFRKVIEESLYYMKE